MAPGSIRLGTYAGIPVRAHWSMAIIAVWLGVIFAADLGIVGGVILTVAFFASILAHEFGHALVARRYGVNTQSIDLWALGGVARLDRESPSPRADGLIAIAGPAVSLLLGVVGVGLGFALRSDVLVLAGSLNCGPCRVQHAAGRPARRRARAPCRSVGANRQQVPGDARCWQRRSSARLGSGRRWASY